MYTYYMIIPYWLFVLNKTRELAALSPPARLKLCLIHHPGRRDEEKQGTAVKELMIGKCHAVLDHRHTAGTMSSCPELDSLK